MKSNFYQWAKKLGINLIGYKEPQKQPEFTVSTLKGRAAELNYKINQHHRLLFDGLPKVEPTKVFDKAFNRPIR